MDVEEHSDNGVEIKENVVKDDVHHEAAVEDAKDVVAFENHSDDAVKIEEKEKGEAVEVADDSVEDDEVALEVAEDVIEFEEDSNKDVQEAEEELPTAAEASEAVEVAGALDEDRGADCCKLCTTKWGSAGSRSRRGSFPWAGEKRKWPRSNSGQQGGGAQAAD